MQDKKTPKNVILAKSQTEVFIFLLLAKVQKKSCIQKHMYIII